MIGVMPLERLRREARASAIELVPARLDRVIGEASLPFVVPLMSRVVPMRLLAGCFTADCGLFGR